MSSKTIAHAIQVLEGLLKGLDQAFWEANSVDRKDFIYDLIGAVHGELSELNKLSVQDHDLQYEPISEEIQLIGAKLARLQSLSAEFLLRATTTKRLDALINDVKGLMKF